MIRRIVEEKWSGSQVLRQVTRPPLAKSSLKEISQRSVEQRFEKRVIDAAKTMHALLTLPQESYHEAVTALAFRAKDPKMLLALQSLRQTLEEVLLKIEDLQTENTVNVTLLSIEPPLDLLKAHLPTDKFEQFETDVLTGSQILDQLLEWRQDDAVLASRIEPFFDQIEAEAEALRAGDPRPWPKLRGEKNPKFPDIVLYDVESGAAVYWAHELLLKRGDTKFAVMTAEVIGMAYVEDD
jgi:hypothetical protein